VQCILQNIKGYDEDLLHAAQENCHNAKIFFSRRRLKVHSFIAILFVYQHSHSGGLLADRSVASPCSADSWTHDPDQMPSIRSCTTERKIVFGKDF
jgi:hypothetical protein